MNDYSLIFSCNHGVDELMFPVLPEKIEVSEAGNSKTYEISQLGEVNVLKSVKLTEITFDSILPVRWFPGATVNADKDWPTPISYIHTLQQWRSNKQPIHFVLTGSESGMNINMYVSIEKLSWTEVAGAPGDIKYQISLKEYRSYAVKKATVVVNTTTVDGTTTALNGKTVPRADTRVQPKTYTLVAGDSLWKVAKKLLGDGAKYKQIQKLNGIKDSDLKKLPIGKVIKLP